MSFTTMLVEKSTDYKKVADLMQQMVNAEDQFRKLLPKDEYRKIDENEDFYKFYENVRALIKVKLPTYKFN